MGTKASVKEPIKFDQYFELIERSPIAIGAQCEKQIIFMNSAGSIILDASAPYQLYGKSFVDFVHPDYKDLTEEFFDKLESSDENVDPIEVKTTGEKGECVFLEIAGTPFEYKGKPAVQFTFHEITKRKEIEDLLIQLKAEIAERKSADEALKKSENKYRNLSKEFNVLLNGIPDNLILLSPDLKIMWANKAAARTFGKKLSEISGQYCYSLCCNIFSPCQNCPTVKSFPSGREETAQISTASDRMWDIRSFPIKDESGNVKSVIELARDITEKVNLQAGATRTRHLASLGELAAGVAHEINNPINNILNYAQILIDDYDTESRDDEIPRRIIKDSDRIATIVRSLLSFARIRKEEKSYHYLHEIFSDTITLSSAQIRKDGINLNVKLPSKFIKVPVQQQQIQQVFLNIISNARFALNEKYPGSHEDKILEISCDEISCDDEPHCQIIFHDSGIGIPDDIIDKVINPFFSTKPDRIGTGLGLSISHGIISEHGGKLLINSIEGEFTKIIINIPLQYQEQE